MPPPKHRELCDVFTCHPPSPHARSTAGRLLARNSERYLKSPQEMQQLFADLPEAIANTLELSSRLEFTLERSWLRIPALSRARRRDHGFVPARAHLGRLSRSVMAAPNNELQARAPLQIERELKLIEKLKLAGYFLIVWDIVRFCREQNILVQGRGSAANSAVCYSLGITAVDPVGMELLFERFLSEERGEWPDIDLDLPSGDEREQAIQYVYQRYGELGAAMTANVITYRNRTAAREMGKALGFDPETLAKISAAVATWEFRDENDALDRRFRDAGLDLAIPACASISNCASPCRICRAISANTPAAWSSARDNSIPSCRWSPRPCRAASSCNGTKKIAPTWASSKSICSAWE